MASLSHPLTGLQMTKIKEIVNRILSRNTSVKMTYMGWVPSTLCYLLHFRDKDTRINASMDISEEAIENTTPDAIARQIVECYQGRGVAIEGTPLSPKKEKEGIKIKLRRKIRV